MGGNIATAIRPDGAPARISVHAGQEDDSLHNWPAEVEILNKNIFNLNKQLVEARLQLLKARHESVYIQNVDAHLPTVLKTTR